MLDILKFIFSNIWVFIGTCILLDLIIVNLFKVIIYFRKLKCVESLSKDGKTIKEIELLLGDNEESEDK